MKDFKIDEMFSKMTQESSRKDLLDLREWIKETNNVEALFSYAEALKNLLSHEDAKTRRLAMDLLGRSGVDKYLPEMMALYEEEKTLFVRADYLKAIEKLPYEGFLEKLKSRYNQLAQETFEEQESVHLYEEQKQIYRMIVLIEGTKEHSFCGCKDEVEVFLSTKVGLEDITLRQLSGVKKKKVPGAVMVKTQNLDFLDEIRTYEECLFYMGTIEDEGDVKVLADRLLELRIEEFLKQTHKESHPMAIRIQYNGNLDTDRKGIFIRKLGQAIEERTKGWLINATTGYEAEVRLNPAKDAKYRIFLKLYTKKDRRFAYRKETIATSIKPYLAANLVQICKPYLQEGAQIIDPYCGVGTMLIERRMVVNAGDTYGVDLYGEAISKARRNSEKVGPVIHYVQRDFSNFTHSYLFDEIITNMPTTSKNVNHQMVNQCYSNLFSKGRELLRNGAIVVVYGNEHGTMKRLLRMNPEYVLLRDIRVDEKQDFHLYVIRYEIG